MPGHRSARRGLDARSIAGPNRVTFDLDTRLRWPSVGPLQTTSARPVPAPDSRPPRQVSKGCPRYGRQEQYARTRAAAPSVVCPGRPRTLQHRRPRPHARCELEPKCEEGREIEAQFARAAQKSDQCMNRAKIHRLCGDPKGLIDHLGTVPDDVEPRSVVELP